MLAFSSYRYFCIPSNLPAKVMPVVANVVGTILLIGFEGRLLVFIDCHGRWLMFPTMPGLPGFADHVIPITSSIIINLALPGKVCRNGAALVAYSKPLDIDALISEE